MYKANLPGPICILEIFRNNLSSGVWLYYQILMIAKMNKTEISAKIMKREKIKVFIIRIAPEAFQQWCMAILPNFDDSQNEQN